MSTTNFAPKVYWVLIFHGLPDIQIEKGKLFVEFDEKLHLLIERLNWRN